MTLAREPSMVGCPCGTGRALSECCAPRHEGTQPAETCEALMRSRYAAFALGAAQYLVATHLGATAADLPGLTEAAQAVTWLGLTVSKVEPGASPDDGFVTFTARSLDEGGLTALTERSRFRRIDGRWLYVDGQATVVRTKVERNAPCPCGSGRKFKQCHA
jgi:SEC-C motif-containing protein